VLGSRIDHGSIWVAVREVFRDRFEVRCGFNDAHSGVKRTGVDGSTSIDLEISGVRFEKEESWAEYYVRSEAALEVRGPSS